MAQSSKNRKKLASLSNAKGAPRSTFPTRYAIYAVALLAASGAIYGIVKGQQGASDFEALAAKGQSVLQRVQSYPNEGRTHMPAGSQITYGTNPPTSGPHYIHWVDPGFYESPKGRSNLVHSLEHGMIVIFYDQPGEAVVDKLKEWTGLFSGPWSGIVSVRKAGLGEKLILTAWRRVLRFDRLEPEVAAAFIDTYRGRGPENPVR